MLHQALVNLAAEPGAQVDRVSGRYFDELALELDDVVGTAPNLVGLGIISENALAALQLLDEQLRSMGGQANARLWTAEALLRAPEWIQVRELAAEALVRSTMDKLLVRVTPRHAGLLQSVFTRAP
jgi:hypothetical protein